MTKFLQTFPGPLSAPAKVRNRSRNPLWRLRRVFFGFFFFGILGLIGASTYFYNSQVLEDATFTYELPTFFCAADVPAGECDEESSMYVVKGINRNTDVVESFDEFPDVLVDALIATEDKEFFNHNGVHMIGFARAIYQTSKGNAQGGSTLTQQVVKNAYKLESSDVEGETLSKTGRLMKRVKEKPREAALAIKLEKQLMGEDDCSARDDKKRCAKEKVLVTYANTAYIGWPGTGFKTGARAYFGKELQDLSLEEAAYLAGVLRNPAAADPRKDLHEAGRRIDSTLNSMLEDEKITQKQFDDAQERMAVNKKPEDEYGVPNFQSSTVVKSEVQSNESYGSEYFFQEVERQLRTEYGGQFVRTGGLKVYTTLDPTAQKAAYESVNSHVDPDNPDTPVSALVSLNGDGQVAAMIGGKDATEAPFNYAMARENGGTGQQPGSTMKPIVMATAIQNNISPLSLFTVPKVITFPYDGKYIVEDEGWTVKGGKYADTEYGDAANPGNYTTMVRATVNSWNPPYVQFGLKVGPERIVSQANEMGIKAQLDPVASITLGSEEVSVLDMASAYSTLEREGVRKDPIFITRIEDSEGQVIFEADSNPGQQAVNPSTAHQVTNILSQAMANGTGTRAKINRDAAGKTGTTQNNADAWFSGYTCDLTTTVWMGYDTVDGVKKQMNESASPTMQSLFGFKSISGGTVPAQIWGDYMGKVTADMGGCQLTKSSSYSGQVLNRELETGYAACPAYGGAVVASQPQPETQTPQTMVGVDDSQPVSPVEPFEEMPTTSAVLLPEPGEQDQRRQQLQLQGPEGNPVSDGVSNIGYMQQNKNKDQDQDKNKNQEQNKNQEKQQVSVSPCMAPGDSYDKRWIIVTDPNAPIVVDPNTTTSSSSTSSSMTEDSSTTDMNNGSTTSTTEPSGETTTTTVDGETTSTSPETTEGSTTTMEDSSTLPVQTTVCRRRNCLPQDPVLDIVEDDR